MCHLTYLWRFSSRTGGRTNYVRFISKKQLQWKGQVTSMTFYFLLSVSKVYRKYVWNQNNLSKINLSHFRVNEMRCDVMWWLCSWLMRALTGADWSANWTLWRPNWKDSLCTWGTSTRSYRKRIPYVMPWFHLQLLHATRCSNRKIPAGC